MKRDGQQLDRFTQFPVDKYKKQGKTPCDSLSLRHLPAQNKTGNHDSNKGGSLPH